MNFPLAYCIMSAAALYVAIVQGQIFPAVMFGICSLVAGFAAYLAAPE